MQGLFDSIFSQGPSPVQQVPAAIGWWARTFMTVAVPQIASRLLSEDVCEHEKCGTRMAAGVRCLTCRRMVCLGHAFVAANGHGICFLCANVKLTDEETTMRRDSPGLVTAFALLGLDTKATQEEVHKRVRTLLGKHHPDKAKKGGEAAAKHQFQLIQQAHDLIKKERGWHA